MNPEQSESPDTLCPECRVPMASTTVRTAIWQGERVAVVEDIPALVCSSCREQYYDDDVSDALRKLSEKGFPEEEAEETIQVPVFSLEGRIRERTEPSEESHVD